MSKDIKAEENKVESKIEKSVETRKPSREELKAKFRRVSLEYEGRLAIDDKYKTPGKVLRIDNDDLATRKYLESLGYTPVKRKVEVGSGSLSEAHNTIGSEVHIEQGIVTSQPGILYECDQEVYDVRKELDAEANNAQLENTITDAQFAELAAKTRLGTR